MSLIRTCNVKESIISMGNCESHSGNSSVSEPHTHSETVSEPHSGNSSEHRTRKCE